jgi:hypothetical protein
MMMYRKEPERGRVGPCFKIDSFNFQEKEQKKAKKARTKHYHVHV